MWCQISWKRSNKPILGTIFIVIANWRLVICQFSNTNVSENEVQITHKEIKLYLEVLLQFLSRHVWKKYDLSGKKRRESRWKVWFLNKWNIWIWYKSILLLKFAVSKFLNWQHKKIKSNQTAEMQRCWDCEGKKGNYLH